MTTQTIGDVSAARTLFNALNRNDYRRAPNGFRKIGEGLYRRAYLETSTKVVYKVGDYDENIAEAKNSRALIRKSTKNLPFNLKIPRTRTYLVTPHSSWDIAAGKYPERVIAQEYALGAKRTNCDASYGDCSCHQKFCYDQVHNILVEFTGLEDMHGSNILLDKDNTFWLIDMAQ